MTDNKSLLTVFQRNYLVSALSDTDSDVWVVLKHNCDSRRYYELPLVPNVAEEYWSARIDQFGEFLSIDEGITHKDVDRFLINTFRSRMRRWNSLLEDLDKLEVK